MHKIHCNRLPFPLRDLQWLQQTIWSLMFSFHLLTHQTSGYKFGNFPLHSAPPIPFFQISIHLGTSWVNQKSRTMSFFKDFSFEFRILWHTKSVMEPYTTIILNSEFRHFTIEHACLDSTQFGICFLASLNPIYQ